MPTLFRLLALLLLASHALAQPADSTDSTDTPLQPGARALLFAVGPDLTLTGPNAGSLGIKWHRSEARALRLGVTVVAAARFETGAIDTNQQFASVSATLIPLHYRRSRTPIYLYTGIGPTLDLNVRRSDAEGQSSGAWFSAVAVGAVGVVGVEWAVAEAVSVTGEYGQSLVLEGAFSDEERLGFTLISRGARMGVAVYF